MSATIDPSLYLTNLNTSRSAGSKLGKDEFLKILMTQLQNQDPLNPMEDKEFISQMANFSSLEQMTNMTKMMEKYLNSQSSKDSLLKYSEMIGKKIEWTNSVGDGINTAIVKSIKQSGTNIVLELDNGKEIKSDLVTKISQPE